LKTAVACFDFCDLHHAAIDPYRTAFHFVASTVHEGMAPLLKHGGTDMTYLNDEIHELELDRVSGGQGISVPVKLKNSISVAVPDGRSIAQRDSPYETNDNLPT
jgi:hypothetical protein